MPTKSSQLEPHGGLTKTRGSEQEPRGSEQQPPPAFATLLKRALPQASVQKANKAFTKFSLSKFPKDSLPSNYVHPYKGDASLTHAERTKHVQDVQKNRIEQYLHKLKTAEQDKPNAKSIKGITLAVPRHRASKLLPSYNKEKGTVTLDDVMDLIAKHMKGTEFHAKGDPTLNRLVLLDRVETIRKTLGLDARGRRKGESK